MDDLDDLLPEDFDDIDEDLKIQLQSIANGYVKAPKLEDFYYTELVDWHRYGQFGCDTLINSDNYRVQKRSYRLNRKKPKGMVYGEDD